MTKLHCTNCGPLSRRSVTYKTHVGVLLCSPCASAYQVGQAYPDNPIVLISDDMTDFEED